MSDLAREREIDRGYNLTSVLMTYCKDMKAGGKNEYSTLNLELSVTILNPGTVL